MAEMITHICPSLLQESQGEAGYSKKALKMLFDGQIISHLLPYDRLDDNSVIDAFTNNSKRISVSGVQVKYSLVVDKDTMRLTDENEQGEFILKPVPNNIRYKDFCPANEHLTMQIASIFLFSILYFVMEMPI